MLWSWKWQYLYQASLNTLGSRKSNTSMQSIEITFNPFSFRKKTTCATSSITGVSIWTLFSLPFSVRTTRCSGRSIPRCPITSVRCTKMVSRLSWNIATSYPLSCSMVWSQTVTIAKSEMKSPQSFVTKSGRWRTSRKLLLSSLSVPTAFSECSIDQC